MNPQDMTPDEYVSEVMKATKCENEVRQQLSKMSEEDRTTVSVKNLKLNLFVIGYDSDRYLNNPLYSRNPVLERTGHGFRGMMDIYELVLKDGVEKWQDPAFLQEQYDEAVRQCEIRHRDIYSLGKLKAIAGIMDGQLYYAWSDGDMPIQINHRFVNSLQKRHLLQ